MNDALYIAATGLHAQQLSVDTIANNLSNVATPGYKASRINFLDLMYRQSAKVAGTGSTAPATPLGTGVGVHGVLKDFTSGELQPTGAPLDVAIQGRGFFEVLLADGSRAYTRGGTLHVNKDNVLAVAGGHALKPEIQVPQGAGTLHIGRDGRITTTVGGQGTPVELGQLELVDFVNANALQASGDGLYLANAESGEPVAGRIGEDGLGQVIQGSLEASNVQMVNEMVSLMTAQRAYELSSRVVQVADTLMDITNKLVRG